MVNDSVEINGCQYSRAIKKLFGIYQIKNEVNGHVYVGSTHTSFLRRWRQHIRELNEGNHENPKLQNAWNKYGAESFSFDVLEVCKMKEFVLDREQAYLDEMDWSISYNINKVAELPPSRKGTKASPETLEKMKQTHSGENNHFFGKTHSEETRKKISEAHKGRKLTEEHKAKVGRKGRVVSEETRKKRSESLKGNPKLIEAQRLRRAREKDCTKAE